MLSPVPRDGAPDDWVPLTHPEGALYWVNRTEVRPSPRAQAPI